MLSRQPNQPKYKKVYRDIQSTKYATVTRSICWNNQELCLTPLYRIQSDGICYFLCKQYRIFYIYRIFCQAETVSNNSGVFYYGFNMGKLCGVSFYYYSSYWFVGRRQIRISLSCSKQTEYHQTKQQ